MPNLIHEAPLYFPLFFLGMWFFVTTLLGFLSGWFANVAEFPDRSEAAIQRIPVRTAMMGGSVSMNRILTVEVCNGGLRFKMLRIFGPFCRNFFVPWTALHVTRPKSFLFPGVKFTFGRSGSCRINAWVAQQIALAAKENWPEKKPIPVVTVSQMKMSYLARWLSLTTIAAGFFILVSLFVMPHSAQRPPLVVAVLFPAIVIGVDVLWAYLRDR